MGSLWAVFFVVVVVAQLQAVAFAAEQREFDYFVLALQWPGTYCSNISRCCPANGCCRGADSPTEFTIHSLWPEYYAEGWPSCCTNQTFNENAIISLEEELRKYWPTYRCDSATSCNNKKGSFWARKYEKHGTCAAPVIVDEYDYFSTALLLFFKYNVTEVLKDAGIIASDSVKYPIENVIGAVQQAFNVIPKLTCGKKGIIKQLLLCFDKHFQPRDCDVTKSCPKSVRLPTYEPKVPKMVEGAISWMVDAEALI